MSKSENDRQAHWQSVYRDRPAGEVSWYQAEPTLSLSLINETDIPLDARILDVGGGASILVDRLLAHGSRRALRTLLTMRLKLVAQRNSSC